MASINSGFAVWKPLPPKFTSADNAAFLSLAPNTFTVTTTPGAPADTTLSQNGPLPPGVTFTDNGDGTATLAGAPTDVGTAFEIVATNSYGFSVTQSFALSVYAPAPTALTVSNCQFTTPAGLPLCFGESQLLAGCANPGGGTLTITSVELTSARGAYVYWTNGLVIYSSWERYFFSDDQFSGLDTFNYTVANDSGETSTGTVTVNVLAGMGQLGPRAISINSVSNGVFLVFLAAYADDVCAVQHREEPAGSSWQNFPHTLIADPGALVMFTDTNAPSAAQRFYRLEDTPGY